jgi:hypothetical protein
MRFVRQLRRMGVAVAAVALVPVVGASARPPDIRIHVNTVGQGLVASSDSRIRCSGRCSAAYDRGVTVALTALPRRFFYFEHWTGDCVGSAPRCIVAIDRRTWVGAVFRRKVGLISLVVSGPGLIVSDPVRGDPFRLVCGQDSSFCERGFRQGTTVKLRPKGLGGGVFEAWGGACAGQSGDCKLLIGEEASEASAAFSHDVPAPGPQTLTVRLGGPGRLTSEPPGISCPPTCQATFPTRTLVAVALSGAPPTLWGRGVCVGRGSSCRLVVDTSVHVEDSTGRWRPATSPSGRPAHRSQRLRIRARHRVGRPYDPLRWLRGNATRLPGVLPKGDNRHPAGGSATARSLRAMEWLLLWG